MPSINFKIFYDLWLILGLGYIWILWVCVIQCNTLWSKDGLCMSVIKVHVLSLPPSVMLYNSNVLNKVPVDNFLFHIMSRERILSTVL